MLVLKYIRLPYTFDVKRLQQEVSLLTGESWLFHYQTMHYEGESSAIPLRSVGGRPDDVIISPFEDAEYADTIFLQRSNCFKEVLATFQCPIKAVRLLKLNAGSVIKEHRDAELCFEKGEVRIHIPIVTNDKVAFLLDNEKFNLREGECWYMNFNLPHAINNNSNAARIHLVIDAVVNEWVKNLFCATRLAQKEIEEPGFGDDTKLQIIAQLRLLNTETANKLAEEMEASINQLSGV
ncbi:MAG: aspartyl/asparaginyl beta-hydroxylase domain-containing protein [Chitinophagaceae bacterium]|nr:aspartyl/asparaginyl beta-hydroxylase domain-containing protein [Chitinophagaceae bacterium]